MMQIDELVLYNREGASRHIHLAAGKLNVITGDSRTGKSSLINIIRFLLGSGDPHSPRGPISQTVSWFALRAHVGDTAFVIARPAPPPDHETNEAMLLVGTDALPAFDDLSSNISRQALRQYLGGLLGLEDNVNVPGPGQTRNALSATFVHSLYYCFQGQGEIANPDILFHRQNREWIPQTIRDTLPFFLGAQGVDELRRAEHLTARRRTLRRERQRLSAAEAERTAGLDRAGNLLVEAADVELITEQPSVETLRAAREVLRVVVENPFVRAAASNDGGGEFDRLRRRRAELSEALRDVADQLRSLEDFATAEDAYGVEASEQHARLASIGLVPGLEVDAPCPVCARPLGDHESPSRAEVESALGRAARRLDLARRDLPRIQGAREGLLARQSELRLEVTTTVEMLTALADTDERVANQRETLDAQSYVRGRIAQYLDSTADSEDAELESLRSQVATLESEVQELVEALDPAAVRSRTDSLLRTVSRQMTGWARDLGLEHATDGAQIDLDRLTIVADTPEGPAYMDRGEIGSGMNWVGYHLSAYLALQDFFIRNARPVPSFIVLDQPSQAFFPRDRQSGGDLDELSDTDRESTLSLYKLVHDVVEQLSGSLQVIALDHADFPDDWFQAAVAQRWRDGEALIPSTWISRDRQE